jgi:hypothetical protein
MLVMPADTLRTYLVRKVPRTRNLHSRGQQQQPPLAEAQQPRVESSDSPASGSVIQGDAGDARPKLLRCHFHPGKVMLKVRPSLVRE